MAMETGFPKEKKRSFDELPGDVRINVFQRLDAKDCGKFKCVSKDWRRLIATACFPKYSGLLCKYEYRDNSLLCRMSYEPSSGILRSHGFLDLDFKNLVLEFQQSCNGLHLLCHSALKGPLVTEKSKRMYRYYVVNPLTKQHAVVHIPEAISGMYKYAALVYHPAESSHFKIVRFCIKFLHIYSSETGQWSMSRMALKDENASRVKLATQSVYFKGAIYRLSMPGHVLRFVVNQTAGEPWTVEEIEIPAPGTSGKMKGAACIGLSNDHIRFAMNDGSSLKIWELDHQSSGWCWTFKFSCPTDQIYNFVNEYPRPVCFLPNLDAILLAYFGGRSGFMSFSCLRYSESEEMSLGPLTTRSRISPGRWDHGFVFPLFECEAPFI